MLAAGAFLRLRDASPLQALELRLRAAAGDGRRGRERRRGPAAGNADGTPDRPPGTPRGLLVTGAAEVATLAGGLRRGGAGRAGHRASREPRWPASPGGSLPSPGGAARARRSRPRSRTSAPRPMRSTSSTRPAGTVTPGLVDAHTHLLFAREPGGRGRAPPARRRLPGDPRGRRRDPGHGRRDAGRVRGPAARTRAALARRDAPPRHHHGRGEVGLRPGHRRRSCGSWPSPGGWQPRARST